HRVAARRLRGGSTRRPPRHQGDPDRFALRRNARGRSHPVVGDGYDRGHRGDPGRGGALADRPHYARERAARGAGAPRTPRQPAPPPDGPPPPPPPRRHPPPPPPPPPPLPAPPPPVRPAARPPEAPRPAARPPEAPRPAVPPPATAPAAPAARATPAAPP